MLRYILLVIPIITACGKSEDSRAAEKKDPPKAYEMKKINKTVDDELSPLGFWEINLEYPILNSSNNPIIDAINKKIEVLSVQYSCEDNRGDKQFNASVTYTNNLVTSIHFTDSWLCAGMPHSDGRIGSITFDHQSGNDVNIENNFVDSYKKIEFTQKITKEFNKLIKDKAYEGCPENSIWNQYYLTNEGINFIYSQTVITESPCELEVYFSVQELENYFKKDSILLVR